MRLTTVLLGVLVPAAVRAELPALVDLQAQYMPGVEVASAAHTQAQVSSYDVAVNVPVVLGAKTFLVPGLSYHVESLSYADALPGLESLRTFHAVEVSALLVQLLPSSWSLSLRLAPGLAGDFRAIDGGVVRLGAVALATHRFSDALTLGGGGLATWSFGELLPLPAVYVDWRPAPFIQIEAFVPAFAHAKWRLGDRFEIGARIEVAGNAYAVRAPDAAPGIDHVSYSVVTAGAAAGARIAGSLWLTAFAGSSVFRRYELKDAGGDTLDGGSEDLANAPFVRAGLSWRLP